MAALRSDAMPQTAPRLLSPLAAASLHDDAIVLGPLLPDDMGSLFVWLNDVDAARLDLAFRPTDWLAYKAWLDTLPGSPSQVLFAIRKLREHAIIGFVIFKNIQSVHRAAELGVRIGCDAERGKGHGTRAVAMALDYAWNHLNLHRVSLTVFAHNARAIASYRAAGFRDEGLLKDAAFIDGEWVDVIPMAAINPREQVTAGRG
jgi:RimJ/RimL family protein N-acetyltransferase